ncbi:carboxylesterase family protein [Streptomyces sp. MS19]|uniref:carboxylesterase family protein n=1 Tax=Streptomyces sp. MS19 TaxID=3385972 RepID=UPI0039A02E4E
MGDDMGAGARDVRLASGTVRARPARHGTGVVAARGIPYASLPDGPAGRFAAPGAPPAWEGVRDGREFGPVAPQSAELPGAPVWDPAGPAGGAALTLNVWAPAARPSGAAGLPVLVWLHGGAYAFGSSAQPEFDGAALAASGGGMVVVTLNYRLGHEGFGLVAGAPPNRGLLDQAAALRWVRDNAAAFGGDPGNVTVAGQSAGATAVVCLMTLARGLFGRAIAHSAVGPVFSRGLAARVAGLVEAAAGPAAAAGSAALVAAADTVAAGGLRPYNPVVHGPVLDGDPLTAVDPGVDLLVCTASHEFWLMDAFGQGRRVRDGAELDAFARWAGLPDGLTDGYRELMPGASAADVCLAVHGDLLFGEYTRRLADTHEAAGGRTYRARYVGGRHGAEVPYAFGNAPGGPGVITAAWAAFAATGDPGWGAGTVREWRADGPPPGPPVPAPERTRALWEAFGYAPASR